METPRPARSATFGIGFANLGMRVHVVCLYVQSAHRYPETQAQEAWGDVGRDGAEGAPAEALAHAKKTAQVPRPAAR
jgi:hypothetical protein